MVINEKNTICIWRLECYSYPPNSNQDLLMNQSGMIASSFILIFILLFPLFFPWSYVGELLLSFLPYLAVISGMAMIVVLIFLRKSMKPGYRLPSLRPFRALSFLMFSFFFFWYSRNINHFYTTQIQPSQVQSWNITILFANIHKDNISYDAIRNLISKTNPDMLMFVEFTDHHYDNLKDFLQSSYPYTNTTTWSKKFVGSMVFSKYPIINRADDFPQWMRRYGYFSLPLSWHEIYFYLVHTSSPDSYNHFVMRNDHLTTLVTDFSKHESDRKHEDITVVWDFNITPWSYYYPILSQAFSWELENMTSRLPFLFTWRAKYFPFLFAHIDHLRTSQSLHIQNLKAIDMPGSDHQALLFTITP